MKFDFKVFAKSVPAICIVSGIACIVISQGNTGVSLVTLDIFLIIAGIGLQILYLYLRYLKRDR